jgi:hypothetical protein
MLVGDILLSAREAVPDLPGTLPPCAILGVGSAGSEIHLGPETIAGGLLNLGGYSTFYLVVTYSTPWGETSPSPELVVTLSGTENAISANPAPSPYQQIATAFNVYIGTSSGGECARYTFPMTVAEYAIANIGGTFVFATPPQGNSAFLLDSGGPVASAQQLFRWLTDALRALSAANGGLPDVCGFATTVGKQNYQVPGEWRSLENLWYDGYPMDAGSSTGVFRRNVLNGICEQLNYVQVADNLVVEVYPQPQRTAGLTSLTAALSATGTAVTTNGNGGFVLPLGLAMLGVPPTYEIVSYSGMLPGLANMIRGLGGTNAQSWSAGTPVTELNVYFTGLRSPQLYTVGQAANSIRIPLEWTPKVHVYLLSRYRTVEQQEQEASALMKDFEAYLRSLSRRKPIVGDRQIIPISDQGLDVRPGLSSTFGGILIP